MYFLRIAALIAALALAACGNNVYEDAAIGGAAGTAAGAGTGAIIGATITNGSVSESAVLGGAIGLPLGILAGVAYNNHSQNGRISDNSEAIRANRQHLLRQERELEFLRNEMRDESSSKVVAPDPDTIEHQYLGPSLGDPRR